MAINPPRFAGILLGKLLMTMSYTVLKAQPKTLNKAKIATA